MQVKIIQGVDNNKELLEQNFALRHEIFVDRMGWEDLRRPDSLDIDEFDNAHSVHFLLLDGDQIVAGSRLNSLCTPTLLQDKFSHLVQRPLPDNTLSADWTRLYLSPARTERSRQSREAGILYCAILEYALSQDLVAITFVGYLHLLNLFTRVGWNVTPLGVPSIIDGKPTVAACLRVDHQSLENIRKTTGNPDPVLRATDFLPSIHINNRREMRVMQ